MIAEKWAGRSGAEFPVNGRPFVWRDTVVQQLAWARKTGEKAQLATGVVGTATEIAALLDRMDAKWKRRAS